MSDQHTDHPVETTDQRRVRLHKLAALRAAGTDPYPPRFERSDRVADIRAAHGSLADGEETDHRVRIAGRLMLLRDQGRLVFATVRDGADEIQLFVSEKVLGTERLADFKTLDLGDWVGIDGTVMSTRKGELSVKVESFTLVSKALRPLPDKWHGLQDVETRFRQRYVDLIVNEEARRVFAARTAAIRALRSALDTEGFVEVETPVLSLIQGGATARPFVTHYNSLGIDSYLRIALELHHKRLIVGGLDRVYEVGRIFRNEGLDARHNPEFTLLEAYQAFADYTDMMELAERLIRAAARAVRGAETLDCGSDGVVDLAGPWRRERMVDLIAEHAGVEITPGHTLDDARAVVKGLGLEFEEHWGPGRLTAEVYDRLVEPRLAGPIFVTHHPVEVSPLAKSVHDDPTVVERFELIVGGNELANAYSELNDPVDQLARFRREAEAKAGGDDEAGDVDFDYIRALEYGMPPTGGLGIGVDRLVMLLAGVSTIREVIYFPTLRPEVFDPADFDSPPQP